MPKLKLKAARVNADVKVEEMADKLKVHHMTVRRWENDECDIPANKFMQYCDICGVAAEDIFLPSDFAKEK